jgi:hypothetical protein
LPRQKNSNQNEKKSFSKTALFCIISGISFGISFMLKFSSVVLIIPIIFWLLIYRKWKEIVFLISGLSLLVIVQGVIDHYTWGSFLHSPIEFLKFNILDGENAKFGVAPFISYVGLIFHAYSEYTLLYLLFVILGIKCSYKHSILLTTFFFYFLVFSFISHKEYRFILPIMPILVLFAAKGFTIYPKRIKKGSLVKPVFIFMVLLTLFFSGINSFYLKTFRPKYQRCLALEWIGQQPDCDVVMLVDGASFGMPGYAYLQKEVLLDFSHTEFINYYTYQYRFNSTYYVISEDQYLRNFDFCNNTFSFYNITLVKTFTGSHFYYDTTTLVFRNFIV